MSNSSSTINVTFNHMKNLGKYFLVEWEANGRDDSDGDVLVYNANTKEVEHNFWTTRGYCPCSYNEYETDKLSDGFNTGKITEDEVKEAMIKSEVKPYIFKIDHYDLYDIPSGVELNIPVKSVGGRGFKGEGILLHTERVRKTDIFGRDCSNTYAIIYKPEDKSLNKTLLKNIEVVDADKINEVVRQRYIDNCTINDLCNYVRASNAQFSGKNCVKTHILATGYCFPYIANDFEVLIDNTTKISGPAKAAAKRAADTVIDKFSSVSDWAKGLDKDTDETNDIIYRTMYKYYGEKINKGMMYLPENIKNFLLKK